MLVLTRKIGENVVIGEGVKILVLQVKGNQVRIGIEAPKNVRICREEIYLDVQRQHSAEG